ncbi:hypothetical protein BHM03_00034528 [Ensete ventricosum]|nr:hypothetical protein BHM03_00034528 [Ensete ventricosum]
MGAAGAEAVEDLRHRDVRGRFRRLLAHVLLCFGRQMVVVTMLYRSSGLYYCQMLHGSTDEEVHKHQRHLENDRSITIWLCQPVTAPYTVKALNAVSELVSAPKVRRTLAPTAPGRSN